ncbi:MAG TPA: hypothetical protein VF511_09365, partial [Chthoniobacterales bacterium]
MAGPGDSLAGCTIARAAEVAQARVLADSFLAFHPARKFTILDLDGAGELESGGNVEVLAL